MTVPIIVTGASRGIGAATACLAARRGHPVLVNYRTGAAEAEHLADRITKSGGSAHAVRADVSVEADIIAMFEACESAFGTPGGLVNNAGITGPINRLENLESNVLQDVLAVNVVGPLLCAREAVRRMSTARGGPGGVIVNVSSRASQLGGAGELVHYAASQGAIDSFTIGLAKEVAGEGIRVNAVNPGLIDTAIHARAGAPDRLERLLPGVPMARVGSPDEVAEGILWLMSDAASYVTGITMPISGGR